MTEPVQPDPEMAEKAIADIRAVRDQAHRYLVARYGKDYVYAAPETFENTLERWIWAVAGDAASLAEECITAIEEHFGGQVMNPAVIITGTFAGLFLLGTGGTAGWTARDRMRPGTCGGCGHPLGCRDSFGKCTRQARVRDYVKGRRAGFKYIACGCRDHPEPVVPTPLDELLTVEEARS